MCKIGEFSKITQVPDSQLRYYDEIGLLRPAKIDEWTGYRYYSAQQIPRLNRILALKDLVLSPGATRTEMADIEGTSMNDAPMPWMEADQVAHIGIKILGKKTAVIPGAANNIMTFMMTHLMPRSLTMKLFGSMMFKMMDPEIVDYQLESAHRLIGVCFQATWFLTNRGSNYSLHQRPSC